MNSHHLIPKTPFSWALDLLGDAPTAVIGLGNILIKGRTGVVLLGVNLLLSMSE